MERLAAAGRSQREEVGVGRVLDVPLLAGDVYRHRHALAVGIVDLQGRPLRGLDMLLVHEAGRRVEQAQELLVFLQLVLVAREGADEQLYLVVAVAVDLYAPVVEVLLHVVVCAHELLLVAPDSQEHGKVDVGQQVVVPGNVAERLLNVVGGELVGRVGKGPLAVDLRGEPGILLALVGQDDALGEHHAVGPGNLGKEVEEINRQLAQHAERLDGVGQHDLVDVNHVNYPEQFVTRLDMVVLGPEVVIRIRPVVEREGEVPHDIVPYLDLGEDAERHLLASKDVMHLLHLGPEIRPFLGVELPVHGALDLLRNNHVRLLGHVLPAFKVGHVGPGKKFLAAGQRSPVFPAAEDVLLLERVALAERVDHALEYAAGIIVAARVGAELLHGVLHPDEDRVVALPVICHADAPLLVAHAGIHSFKGVCLPCHQ